MIKALRKKYNLTQKQIADKMDLSISVYGKIERGEIQVTIDHILKMCKVYNVCILDITECHCEQCERKKETSVY